MIEVESLTLMPSCGAEKASANEWRAFLAFLSVFCLFVHFIFLVYLVVLRRPPLTSGQQFLVIPTALGDLELKRRKMKGLIAELDTIVIPIIACESMK